MNRNLILLFFAITIFSCRDNSSADSNASSIDSVATEPQKIQIDSTMLFTVDNYPITGDMLEHKGGDNSTHRIKNGHIHSLDKIWFRNDTLKQTLVLEVGTDHFRMIWFHFYHDDVPPALIDEMGLNLESGDTATFQQKTQVFDGFIKMSPKVSQHYFTTEKGFKLGDDKQKALTTYGRPDNVTTAGNKEILEWDYKGNEDDITKEDLKGKPIAKDCFAHHIKMFFKNDRLVAMILHNEIP